MSSVCVIHIYVDVNCRCKILCLEPYSYFSCRLSRAMATQTIAPSTETMSIGELAKRMGVTTRTVRYYEEKGLLVGVIRGANGRRMYTAEHLYQLRLIRRGKLLGMSLAEMKELVEVFRRTGTERSVIQRSIDILTSHLEEVEDKLRKLESYRRLLTGEIKRIKALL